jgi:hypothetical protein
MDMKVVMSVKYLREGGWLYWAVADFETYLYAKHVHGPFKF